MLEAVAQQRLGKLKVLKLNVDENPESARRFAVRSIPSLKLFQAGRLEDSVDGAAPLGALDQFLDLHGIGRA